LEEERGKERAAEEHFGGDAERAGRGARWARKALRIFPRGRSPYLRSMYKVFCRKVLVL